MSTLEHQNLEESDRREVQRTRREWLAFIVGIPALFLAAVAVGIAYLWLFWSPTH
jgi:hypothetical protein